MKNLTLILSILFILLSYQSTEAQIWKKIQKKAEKKIEQKTEEKIEEVLNEKKVETEEQKQDDSEEIKEKETKNPNATDDTVESTKQQQKPEIWRNYKYIPGEKIIFYDDLKFEEVGEFPSRWDLVKGGAEVALFNGEKVIIGTADYNNRIIPLFEDSNYLTDEFTVEFDIYVESSKASSYWTEVDVFLDSKRMKYSSGSDVHLLLNRGKQTEGHAMNSGFALERVPIGEMNAWHHIAFSYNKGKFKLYYDDKRIANLPRIDVIPNVVAINFRGHSNDKVKLNAPIKNIRIAHGGGQMYKRIMADGKYTTNGILFDSGKAIIKSQSMGILNKVVSVMNENPEWKFQIIGHTDSDGTTESNLSLSQQRADAVKQTLVTLGIKADKLSTLGKGESESLNTNASPEEKANNRRVEFIKQ